MNEKNKFMHDLKNQINTLFEALKLMDEQIESDPEFAKEICQKILQKEEKFDELLVELKKIL